MAKTYQAPTLFCDILQQSHTLIAGQTGSGKSVMLNGIITTALKYGGNKFIFCDPKRVELRPYKRLPNCIAYAVTSAETVRALDKAMDIMEERYKETERKGQKQYQGEPIYIFIDELADLLISEDGKRIETQLRRLTALGRAAQVHCVLATQAPNRRILRAELVLNIPCRCALHCQTAIESRQVINESGAENLPMYGECLYLRPGHKVELWEVPLTPESETEELIETVISECKPLASKIVRFIA